MPENTRECPSCALEVPADVDECPYCGYEFPEQKRGVKSFTLLFVVLMLGWALYELVHFLG